MRNTKKGFTLVELLVVIAILAILATVSVVGYTNYIKNANESLALQELSQVKSSILAEDIVNNNFAIGSDGKVNAEGVDAFNDYLEDLANGLNGGLAYADGKVTYTLEKDTSVVYVLDLKTGEVEAGTATQTPVTPPAGGEEGGETPVEPEPTPDPDPEPETPAEPKKYTFDFGDKGEASHSDGGNAMTEDYTETVDGLTLTLTSMSKVSKDARDAKGNSCLKLGTGDVVGGFTFTVGDTVDKVVIYVSGYKDNSVDKVLVNSAEYEVTTLSNNGVYTAITIDTTTTKTITFSTMDTYKRTRRVMIDKIELVEE